MSPTSIPRLARGCRIGKSSTLLIPEGVLKLNDTAFSIIELCDGRKTLTEIISRLQMSYPSEPPQKVSEHVILFFKRLLEIKAIEFDEVN